MAPIINVHRVPPAQLVQGVPYQSHEDLSAVQILVDDGGAECFNWSGLLVPQQGFAPTPRLDFFRSLGVTLLRAYSPTICGPARTCIEFGQYGFRTGGGANYDGSGAPGYAAGLYGSTQTLVSLAAALSLARPLVYSKCWTGKCHLTADVGLEGFPISIGWDRYVGCQTNASSLETWPFGQQTPNRPGDPGYVPLAANTGHFRFRTVEHNVGGSPASQTFGAAGTWPAGGPYVAWNSALTPNAAWDAYKTVRDGLVYFNAAAKPVLLRLAINPPHAPFMVPPYTAPDDVGVGATMGTFRLVSVATEAAMAALGGGIGAPGFQPTDPDERRLVFNANLEALDSLVGWFWDRADPTKRAKTVFVLWGDNGTVAQAVGSPYDSGHAKRSPYEQGLRVPGLIWTEHSIITAKGRTSDHLAHAVDLFPTVLDLLRCDQQDWNPSMTIPIDGRSLMPMLMDPSAPPSRTHIYTEIFEPLGSRYPGQPTGLPPIPAIDPTLWVRTFSNGVHKLITWPVGATPRYELYRITGEAQPASGLPGYLERPADNLYPLATDGLHRDLALVFSTLQAGEAALLAS